MTSIGWAAFSDCTGLTSITIPDSVTSIGSYAFSDCTGLTSITIPDSVTSIGEGAFSRCTGLTSVTIPDGVTSIGDYAFNGCTGLTSVTIPDSVTSIGDRAFYKCTMLTSVTIPDSVTNIGWAAFSGCTGLTSVTIPDSVTSIDDDVFYKCTGLTSITLPDSVTSIGNYVFYECTGLTSITLPDSVTSIGSYAFSHCTGLTSITLPDSVTSIDSYAFSYCRGLTSITVPDSLTSIGSYAFSYCRGLTSITVPDSLTSIGFCAFDGCFGLTDVYYGGTKDQWASVRIANGNAPLSAATIHYIDPASIDLSGNYYIAGTKASGEVYYMSAQGTATYRQADQQTDLTAMPASIDADVNAYYVWTLTKDANGTYTINATYGTDKYIGWTANNSAPFVTAENAKALTVTQTNGITHINFVVDPEADTIVTRHFSFNSAAPRFAFYANTYQRIDLVLIPVTAEPAAHEHSYAWDGNVGADGFHTLVCANSDGLCDALTTTEACTYVEGVCSVCGAAEPVVATHTATYQAAIPADCSTQTDGFVGYWYCAECLNDADGAHYGKMYSDEQLTTEIALADAAVAWAHTWVTDETVLPTCTEDGYTAVHCSVCSATDMINIVDNLGGHIWRAATAADGEGAYLAATCTEAGMYVDICDRCGALGSEIHEIPALGHNYIDGVCTCCGAVNSEITGLKISTASVVLYQNIAINYAATVPADMTNPYMVFIMNGNSTTVYPSGKDRQGRQLFEFKGLTPDMMGDNIMATLYATAANGQLVHDCKPEYSIRKYCINVMSAYPDDAKLQTLLSDMLLYGAAAQTYTGHNADALVTDGIYLPAASVFTDLTSTDFGKTGTADANIRWTAAGVMCGSQMSMFFDLVTTVSEATTVEVTINGRTTVFSYADMVTDDPTVCRVVFRGISACEYGDTVTAVLKNNGVQVGETVTYSVNSYVYSKQHDTSKENLAALVQAIYNYGASAKNYLG